MRLATIPNGTRDGALVVVSSDGTRAAEASVAPSLLRALETWETTEPSLRKLAVDVDAEDVATVPFADAAALAPLPRTFQWLDGSVYANHGRLMSQALGVSAPVSDDPLIYQGLSHRFLAPSEDVPLWSPEDELDFEGEVGVVLDDVPAGSSVEECAGHIKLLALINDWSHRRWAGIEMARGFGFVQAKPATALAPLLVTPDELGPLWHAGVLGATLTIDRDGERFGDVPTDEMSFTFPELIAYAARYRDLAAGTIIGGGTVSSARFAEVGSACIAERRGIERIELGSPRTPYLSVGETVSMEVVAGGRSVFGAIRQRIVPGPHSPTLTH